MDDDGIVGPDTWGALDKKVAAMQMGAPVVKVNPTKSITQNSNIVAEKTKMSTLDGIAVLLLTNLNPEISTKDKYSLNKLMVEKSNNGILEVAATIPAINNGLEIKKDDYFMMAVGGEDVYNSNPKMAQAFITIWKTYLGGKLIEGIPSNIGKGVTQAEKLSMNQIDDLIDEIGGSIKNHPLRQEYENAVKNLSNYEVELRGKGLNEKKIAQAMHQARRDLGVQYKNLTPDALREYIYEVNIKRYDGDPLGGSFEFFENKYMGDYNRIIEGAKSPNGNVDKLLEGFKKWLIEKNK